MSNRQGWIGLQGQVLHYLRTVGADRDAEGRFLIGKGQVATFLGMDLGDATETVIDSDALYYHNGYPCGLAAGLHSTSYGVKVYVIA